nr:hypothetical protein [Candidatus Sigynarchaeota archaeon]
MVNNTCDDCGGSSFRMQNDSILKRKLPFINGPVMMCETCGAKYLPCECGALFTRVHLMADIEGVRDTCPGCGKKNEEITLFIQRGGVA